MEKNEKQSWVTFCPPEILGKLQKMLDYPPGTPGYDKVYDLVLPPEYPDSIYYDDDLTSSNDENKFTEFRRYAAAWGKYAEALTARYLLSQGLPIREWNWKPGNGHSKGEIDLITQKGNRIIFVEVKARCGHNSDPWDAIDDRKRRNICRGANIYLKMQKEDYDYQFDVALLTGNCADYKFEYIEDAFMAPLGKYR